MPAQPQGAFRFGPFLLDCSEHVLTRDGTPIPLTPKAFDTLRVLVENAGHLVTKKALLDQVWGETFVEESTLSQNIFTLRKALGAPPDGQQFIETIPKLGYRFVAPVEAVPPGNGSRAHKPEPPPAPIEPEPEAPSAISATNMGPTTPHAAYLPTPMLAGPRRWFAIAAVVLLLVAAAYLVFSEATPQQAAPVTVSRPRPIAVLPFRNVKPDPQWDYLGPALAQVITDRLSYESQMTVRPVFSARRYRNPSGNLGEMARDLHVDVIIAGSYIVEDGGISLSAEMIDVARQKTLWEGEFAFSSTEALAPEAAIIEKLREVLQVETPRPAASRGRISANPPNAQAYESYLRGLDAGLRADRIGARRFYENALRADPQYGPALALLGMEMIGAAYGASSQVSEDSALLEKGMAFSANAIEKNVASPALLTRTGLYLTELGRLEAGITHLRRAVKLNPRYPEARLWLSQAYRYAGFLEESRAEAERALDLDPSLREYSTINTYLYLGQYGRFLETMPQSSISARTLFYRGLAWYAQGEPARAEGEFTRAYEMEPRLIHAQYGQAFSLSMRGQREEALRILRSIEDMRHPDGEMLYKLAQGYAVAGDHAATLRLLRGAVDADFVCYDCFVRDPLLKPINADPDFQTLLQETRQRQAALRKTLF